ncbi:transcription elongation factor (TFIIS) family protein [Wolffia australiana]
MVLEDFFTLSEMKDGLANRARVEELISIMESQNDSVGGIGGDAVRQWSTVSNIIAATEREDCLEHFIRLNGLSYLNRWLEEAQKHKKDGDGDSATDELVKAVLAALDRLPADREVSSTSGIGSTIKRFFKEASWGKNISEKVKILTAKWSFSEDGEDKNYKLGSGDESKSSSASSPKIDTAEDAGDLAAKEEVNAVDDDVVKQKTFDLAAEEDRNLGEAMEVVQTSSAVTGPSCPVVSTPNEPLLASEVPPSASPRPSPESRERRNDTDERPDCSHSNDKVDERVEPMDIEVSVQEPSTSDVSPKKISSIPSGVLSGSRRLEDVHSISELKQEGTAIGLEYGEIDALEVARQVAIEVEREVVDYREPFCSSSPDVAMSEGEMVEDPVAETDAKKVDAKDHVYSGNDDDDDKDGGENDENDEDDDDDEELKGSSSKDNTRNSDNVPGVEELGSDPVKSPKSSSSASESSSSASESSSSASGSFDDSAKKPCHFDLNEDVHFAEDDNPGTPDMAAANLSTPVAVAASKGPSAMPAAPLHFEGELGWRGSAATSAFRPASLPGLKSKAAIISIDLNVVDDEDEGAFSFYDPETSSRSDRLKLDLNRCESDELPQSQASFWRPLQQNGVSGCASPASSSSSRQPSFRDFDLNDDPSANDHCGSSGNLFFRPTSKDSATTATAISGSSFRSYRHEDPAVMIMGSRLGMDRRDMTVQLLNQRSGPYPTAMAPPPPPHGFGYSTPMSILPPPYYAGGSVPYMVDTSGAAVVPQILSSAGVAHGSARPPFLMGVVGPPPTGISVTGGGNARPGLDLNSGGAAGHGEGGSFRHMQQGGSGFVEDRVLKRKEPDCGWDPTYSFGCKQATSWQ